jgi:hypothetical protein
MLAETLCRLARHAGKGEMQMQERGHPEPRQFSRLNFAVADSCTPVAVQFHFQIFSFKILWLKCAREQRERQMTTWCAVSRAAKG